MKTKDYLTVEELEFAKKRVAEMYEEDIDSIHFMAQAIILEKMCFNEGMFTKDKYNEKIENWAKRIKVVADRLDDLKL